MKKLVYVLIAMAFPFVISSCKSEAAKAIDAACDCYAEHDATTQDAYDKLDQEKKDKIQECLDKAGEAVKGQKDVSEEEQISMLEDMIAAIDASDCNELEDFKGMKGMFEMGLKSLKEKGGEEGDKEEE